MQNLNDLMNRLHKSTCLPHILLLVGLITVFIFQNDQHSFNAGHHGFLSSHGMTLASNLSVEHNFLMFNKMSELKDGIIKYDAYNRFPIGAFAIIKLFILPFHDNLSMQISVARMLMNAFFFAAAYLAYISVFRITRSGWVATTATLLAFSSFYCLYYSDMIFNDIPSLFGIMLIFHGMVVFIQDGRFIQLIIKSCAALLLGWQAFAILLPFTIFGCTKELVASRLFRSIFWSRYFILGASSLLFGTAILASNLAIEYLAIGGPLQELPTLQKMLWRFGLSAPETYDQYSQVLTLSYFLKDQLYRIGHMSIPYILVPSEPSPILLKVIGICALLTSLVGAVIARQKIPIASLFVAGLCWALPMRHFVAFHDFQSIFYIGIPVILFTILGLLAEKASKGLIIISAGGALLIFSLSCLHLNIMKADAVNTKNNILTTEFQIITDYIGTGRRIFVYGDSTTIGGGFFAVKFYLAGNYLQPTEENVDFILSGRRDENLALLTPQNQRVFLYKARPKSVSRVD